MSTPGAVIGTALEPLRTALLAHARAEAAQIGNLAAEEAAHLLESARSEVDAQVSDARRQGEADARALLRLERARLDRESRAVVLRAQRAVYDELVQRAGDAVRSLLGDPRIRRHLESRLRDQLGPDATITETEDGGLRARVADGPGIDASVRALVENALRGLDLEDLWAAAE